MPFVVAWLLCFILSFPTIALLFFINDWQWLPFSEWGYVLGFTIYQSLLSSLLSLTLGYWGAWSLLSSKGVTRKYLEVFYLLPNLVPTLFVIISTMSLFDWIGGIPQGAWGIVLLHGIINTGLAAIAFARSIERLLGPFADLARVDGVSLLSFHSKVALPLLARDIFLIGFLIFSTCFTSFSIPLVVGGLRGTTMEVLIYEKIRNPDTWSAAIYLSLLQVIFLFCFSFLLRYLKSWNVGTTRTGHGLKKLWKPPFEFSSGHPL